MSKTYKYLALNGNGIVFANIAKPANKLSFTGGSANIPGQVGTRRVQTIQNTIANTSTVSVLPEGCTDSCSALSATLSARVSLSGPAQNVTELKTLWEETKQAVDMAIAEHNVLLGFKPSANTSFVLGV